MTDIDVNTSSPPALAGNTPRPAMGTYCNVQDVFLAGVGLRWTTIQDDLDYYASMTYSDATTVPDMITNYFIPEMEEEVDGFLNMTYKPTQRSKFFDGDGSNEIWLPQYPVISIDKCTIFAMPTVPVYTFQNIRYVSAEGEFIGDATDFANADLLCEPETGRVYIPPHAITALGFPLWNYTFLQGKMNIQVNWKHGFSATENIPLIFRRAVAMLVVNRIAAAIGNKLYEGAASTKIGDSARVVGREKNLPFSDYMSLMDKNAWKMLSKYKKVG